MKLKLDENLGARGAALLQAAGHDVRTVLEQGFISSPDAELIEACRAERRCLVTLDREFGNPLLYRPADYPGIAVLRLPPRPTPGMLQQAVQTLVGALAQREIIGKLWTVQIGRIREHENDPPEDSHDQ